MKRGAFQSQRYLARLTHREERRGTIVKAEADDALAAAALAQETADNLAVQVLDIDARLTALEGP